LLYWDVHARTVGYFLVDRRRPLLQRLSSLVKDSRGRLTERFKTHTGLDMRTHIVGVYEL